MTYDTVNGISCASGGTSSMQKEIDILNDIVTELGKRASDTETDLSEHISASDTAFGDLNADVGELRGAQANSDLRLNSLESDVDLMSALVDTESVDTKDIKIGPKDGTYNYLYFKYFKSTKGPFLFSVNRPALVFITDRLGDHIFINFSDKDNFEVLSGYSEDLVFQNGNFSLRTEKAGQPFYIWYISNFQLDEVEHQHIGEEVVSKTGFSVKGNLSFNIADFSVSGTLHSAGVMTDEVTTGDLVASDAVISTENVERSNIDTLNTTTAEVGVLSNSSRNLKKDKMVVPTHPTTEEVYIEIPKFDGTFRFELVKDGVKRLSAEISRTFNVSETIGIHYSRKELNDLSTIEKFKDKLYFKTFADGELFYSYDTFGETLAPETYVTTNKPYGVADEIYTAKGSDRYVYFGDKTVLTGVDVLGQLGATIIERPEVENFESLSITKDFSVGGKTTLSETNVSGNLEVLGTSTLDKVDTNEATVDSLTANNIYGNGEFSEANGLISAAVKLRDSSTSHFYSKGVPVRSFFLDDFATDHPHTNLDDLEPVMVWREPGSHGSITSLQMYKGKIRRITPILVQDTPNTINLDDLHTDDCVGKLYEGTDFMWGPNSTFPKNGPCGKGYVIYAHVRVLNEGQIYLQILEHTTLGKLYTFSRSYYQGEWSEWSSTLDLSVPVGSVIRIKGWSKEDAKKQLPLVGTWV